MCIFYNEFRMKNLALFFCSWSKSNFSFIQRQSLIHHSLTSTMAKKQNLLGNERSPYLLQHALNPVEWYPWGEQAFQRAKQLNRPIFLSGHWCHVMERESFENDDIAAILNENFVSIKVDREERPDVDKLYMAFVTGITGGGGWPMSVFLTPDLKPITGGTYFPPKDSYGRPGFASVLRMISEKWNQDHKIIEEQGLRLATAIEKSLKTKQESITDVDYDKPLQSCFTRLERQYDLQNGGFGRAPKFPKPVDLDLLLYKYYNDKANGDSIEIVRHTLTKMFNGGIHDHVGKGFHRYSVDSAWHVPHFEKMLYDQGQLLRTYANFSKLTGELLFAVKDLAGYVMEYLSHPAGGFYSAEDADSYSTKDSKEKREGAFYVWTKSEIEDVLGDRPARHNENVCLDELICSAYGVVDDGNVSPEADPYCELTGQNILHLRDKENLCKIASENRLTLEQLFECLKDGLKFLNIKRSDRPRPHLDNKFITGWNSLMISGLCAAAGTHIDENFKQILLQRAQSGVNFIKQYLQIHGELLHTAYVGDSGEVVQIESPIKAFSDDYVFLIEALLDLYEMDFDESHLFWAKELQSKLDEYFWDCENNSGYFMSRSGDCSIFARIQGDQDGAEPSANSIAVSNLIRMSVLFDCKKFKTRAENIFAGAADQLYSYSYALPKMCVAYHSLSKPPPELVVVGDKGDENTKQFLHYIQSLYIPLKAFIFIDTTKIDQWLLKQNNVLAGFSSPDHKPSVYICRNFACELPVHNLDELKNRIGR